MTEISQTETTIVAGVADADGLIVNAILVAPQDLPDIPGVFVPPTGATPIIGGRWDGSACHPPPPPPPPEVDAISDRQFAMEARDRGFLTQAEAVAFVSSGALPTFIVAFIASLPTQAARDDAEITIAGATVLERHHPLTLALGERMRGETPLDDFLDDFFGAAGMR